MKKLFALVLTLVMVFAIAAPAMAAIGFPAAADPAPGTYDDFSVVAYQLQYDGVTTFSNTYPAFGGLYYPLYTPTAGVVRGTPVRFAAVVTIPDTDKIENYATRGYDYLNLALELTTSNLENVKYVPSESKMVANSSPAVTTDGLVGDWTVDADGVWTSNLVDNTMLTGANSTTLYVMFTATVAESAKDATAKFDLTAGQNSANLAANSFVDALGTTNTVLTGATGGILFNRGTNQYVAIEGAGTMDVINTATETGLRFNVDEAKKDSILNFFIIKADGSVGPRVNIKAGNILYETNPTTIEADPTLDVVVKDIFGALGFSWTTDYDTLYFSEANAVSLAAQMDKAGLLTWKAFTASLTVTDGTSVPNTGDNMSVIGFVMVGLAVLATAAVVVKKVRA